MSLLLINFIDELFHKNHRPRVVAMSIVRKLLFARGLGELQELTDLLEFRLELPEILWC